MNLIKDILDKWNIKGKIDLVVPVPPSNKERKYQAVYEIAKEIANYIGKECKIDVLYKESNLQVKDGKNISGTIKQSKNIEKQSNILVIDDLYSTGATLNEVCKVLRNDKNVGTIYCLAMTKTKG